MNRVDRDDTVSLVVFKGRHYSRTVFIARPAPGVWHKTVSLAKKCEECKALPGCKCRYPNPDVPLDEVEVDGWVHAKGGR